jgi:uncharacterized protein (DUF1330 family)
MAAYVISDLEVRDPGLVEEYRRLAATSIAKQGGRYIVRGGETETVEGNWAPKLIVIVEFPTMQRAPRYA